MSKAIAYDSPGGLYAGAQTGAADSLSRRDAVISLCAIVLVALALRPAIVSVGPALPSISATFGLPHWVAALLTTIPDLLMGLLALPTPWLAHRFGRDRLIIAALVLLTLSTAGRAFSPDVYVLLATTAGVGVGIAIAGTLLSGVIKANFPTRAATVMGMCSTALSGGSTLSAVATAPMANAAGGWRFAVGIWAVLGVVAVLAWLVVTGTRERAGAANVAPRASLPWKNPIAWRVAIFFACVNLIFYALVAWTAPIFLEFGLTPGVSGILLGCFTAAFMIASATLGWLSKSTDRRPLLAGCSALTLIGLAVIALAPTWSPILAIVVTAFGLGGAFTLGMTLPLDNTHNASETNAWTAFTLTIGYLIAAAGPLMVGALRDITGGFQSSVLVLVAIAACMMLIALRLKPSAVQAPSAA